MTSHMNDFLRKDVKVVLDSKLEEFSLLGYERVTEQELWNFLTRKKWRKETEPKLVHEVVSDIMSIKVGEFINYATVEAFKEAEFSFNDEDELRELLK